MPRESDGWVRVTKGGAKERKGKKMTKKTKKEDRSQCGFDEKTSMILTLRCWRAREGGTKREEKQIENHINSRAQKGSKGAVGTPPGGPGGGREGQNGRRGAPEEPRKAGKEEPGEQRRAARGRTEVGAMSFSDFLPPEERRKQKNRRNEPQISLDRKKQA